VIVYRNPMFDWLFVMVLPQKIFVWRRRRKR
jgi:hypothetical protein